MSAIDWPRQVFDQQWLQSMEKLAQRRFPEAVTAEEASTYVLDKLAENDWARCRQYRGQSRVTTFLYSLSARLLEEFSRQRYGRARPPRWLQQQGDLWVTLWKRLCLERFSANEVIERFCGDGRRERELIRNIIRTIKARLPWCGASNLPIPAEYLDDNGEIHSVIDAQAESLEDSLDKAHLRETLATLGALLDDSDTLDDLTPELIAPDLIAQARNNLSLDHESLLMLKMHFQDGLSFAAIARALGVANHQPGRQIKRSLRKIHTALEQAGLHLGSAAEVLGEKVLKEKVEDSQ